MLTCFFVVPAFLAVPAFHTVSAFFAVSTVVIVPVFLAVSAFLAVYAFLVVPAFFDSSSEQVRVCSTPPTAISTISSDIRYLGNLQTSQPFVRLSVV